MEASMFPLLVLHYGWTEEIENHLFQVCTVQIAVIATSFEPEFEIQNGTHSSAMRKNRSEDHDNERMLNTIFL